MSSLAPDPVAIRHHVETLYGTAESGYLPLWHLPSKRTVWLLATDQTAIADAAMDLAADGNVYTGVALHPAPLGEHARGAAAGVCGIPGFWLDLDVAGPGHQSIALPPAHAAQDLVIGAVSVPPSYVVSSGGGLHLYWLFHEFWSFADAAEHHHAARLARRLQWLVMEAARKHGWIVDNTGDLSRVLRPAGTINRKPGLPARPVRVLQDIRRRYTIEELEAVLPLDDPAFPPVVDQAHTRRLGPARAPAAFWSRIKAQCPYMAHCEHDAATLSEPEWHAMMTILGRSHNGEAIAHRVSAPYPGYDASETAKKFAYAFRADAPMHCATIRASRGGEPWCGGCPQWGRITSPITLGYAPRYYHQPAPQAGQELSS